MSWVLPQDQHYSGTPRRVSKSVALTKCGSTYLRSPTPVVRTLPPQVIGTQMKKARVVSSCLKFLCWEPKTRGFLGLCPDW